MTLNWKNKALVTFLLLLMGLDGSAQISVDSIGITADNYSKYLGLTCALRESLIQSVEEQNTIAVDSLDHTCGL